MDRDYQKVAAAQKLDIDMIHDDDPSRFPIEEARFRSMLAVIVISITSSVGYGWAVQAKYVSCTHS